MQGIKVTEMKIGDEASFTKTVSETDVYMFAGITGDLNPAHVNEEHAKTTMFKTRIAHGMLSAGFISTVLGMYLPGPGTIYLSQSLKFSAPVRIGDTVTATGKVTEINVEKNRIKMEMTCTNQEGKVVTSGEAVCMPPR